jgi:hypothetical protein
VERADRVLARRQVDARLPADPGVDHPHERRRHRDPGDAAQVGGGDEPGHVGGGAATEADDHVAALDPELREARPGLAGDRDRLGRLADRQPDGDERLARRADQAQHRAVGHERRTAGADQPAQLGQRGRPGERREQRLLPVQLLGVDEGVGGCVVEAAPGLVEVGEPARLGGQRPVAGRLLDPPPGRLRRDVEQHRERAVAQPLADQRRGDRAAAERDHDTGLVQEPHDHPLLERPELGLAVVGEDRLDRLARVALDRGVGVDRPPPEPFRQGHGGGGLPRAHEADQGEVAVRPRNHAEAMRSR